MATDFKDTRDNELKGRSPLRRYMDLPKYVDLLRSQTLYFRRADLFSDHFEGALTPLTRKSINSRVDTDKSPEGADVFYQRCRKGTFVNCWTYGAKDNMALWQLFGGASSSVAISTTAERVAQICQGWNEETLIRKVKYIDHFENPNVIINDYTDPLHYKNEAFEFEREVRLILPQQSNWEQNPEGLRRPIANLNELITGVVVAPNAGNWFLELVQDLGQRYGLKAQVKLSQLAFPP